MNDKIIERNDYLNKIIVRKENGLIKILTGIRRCGKSYMLNYIFYNHLIECGVKEEHIIKLALDREENIKYHDSKLLNEYILSNIKDKKMYYILLVEIQLVEGFEFVLNGFLYVVCIDEEIIGYMSCWINKKEDWDKHRVVEIGNIYVQEEYKNHGVGTDLINIAKKICKDNNIKFLEVKVLYDNVSAQKFYEKNNLNKYMITKYLEV